MARAKTEPERAAETHNVWHQVRQAIAVLLFAATAAVMLYGAWLALMMHFTKAIPAHAIGRYLVCAVLAAALFTLCARIEPLPVRRKRRGKRWINVETPTQRQIWETAPGDFIEAIFAAIGMMAAPAMVFIDFFFFVDFEDFAHLMIATAVVGGAFAIEGAFISWRGRNMFDPPGAVRAPKQEPKESKAAEKSDDTIEIGSPGAEAAGSDSD
jgi:hypothetical protein